MAKKVGLGILLLVVAFLAGFAPQYSKRTSLEAQLKEAGRKSHEAELRDLAALAYIQAAQKNYGLAAQTAADFFSRLQQSGANKAFDEVLGYRDKITAELAKGDPAALDDLQTVYLKTRAAGAR
jgi:Lon protease-like protein